MIPRILVVSLGSVGLRHLKLLRRRLPNADIRVLRHSGCTEDNSFANGCFSSLESASKYAPHATVVSNPAPFHLQAAIAMANVGSHLLVEKPLSNNCEDVHKLIEVVRRKKLVLNVGYNLRYLLTLQRFREEIHAGRVGTVQVVRSEVGQYLPSWRPKLDYRKSVSANRHLGGGVLLELSHEIDYLRWIFGDVAYVSAWMGRQSNLEIDVEDCAQLTLVFRNDGDRRPAVASLLMDFLNHDTTRRCTAIGTKGSLHWDAVAGTVELVPRNGVRELLFERKSGHNDTYRAQIDDFISAIRGTEVTGFAATGSDGLNALQVVEAAHCSSLDSGRQVTLAVGEA